MIETIATADLPIREVMRIKKNSLCPEQLTGEEQRLSLFCIHIDNTIMPALITHQKISHKECNQIHQGIPADRKAVYNIWIYPVRICQKQ